MSEFDYDLFVIGAGSGGVRASRIAAGLGARVAVAEERYFGGTCVNVGCVPKKLFSYAAHFHDDFQDSAGYGWESGAPDFNWSTLVANKDNEINRLNGIYEKILKSNNVTIFESRARITGPNSVSVDDKTVTAKHILLAVGGWPSVPGYPGSEHAITSNEVFYLDKLPKSIVVQGGGYIALEFASIFARFGVETTLVYRGDKLLRGFDEEIRDFITEEIGRHVTLKLNDDIVSISKEHDGLKVLLTSGIELAADEMLAATGRKPMTTDLGLDTVNVELSSSGGIKVNEEFQSTEPSIYAVGDVIERMALTPVALAEGQIVSRQLFGGPKKDLSYENIATAVFCHPNIATVGLSEQEAIAKGLDIDVYTSKMKPLKHTLSGRNEYSFAKLIVNRSDDRVIGMHLVAADAGELVQGFAVAMNCGATKADFDNTIGIHPTLAEELVTMREIRD
ncbi:MAG TPA: glutathione-disulfide reductase [Gammaproteobacteria bacterium]|nr:glutathione-disulfide reductase [Gammaproteobacteria bacterium]